MNPITEKRPVVLLHSSVSSSRQWRKLENLLQDSYWPIGVDLLGYGETPLPVDAPRPFPIDAEIAHVERILAGVPGPIHIVGHSYGGAVGIKFALRYPARVCSVYAHEPVLFKLLFTEGCVSEWDEIRRVSTDVAELIATGNVEAAMQRFLDYWNGAGAWQAISADRKAAFAGMAPKLLLDFETLLGDRDSLPRYAELACPVLITAGEHGPPTARTVAALLGSVLPSGSFRVIPGAGHMAPVTNAESVNGLVLDHLARAEAVVCPAR